MTKKTFDETILKEEILATISNSFFRAFLKFKQENQIRTTLLVEKEYLVMKMIDCFNIKKEKAETFLKILDSRNKIKIQDNYIYFTPTEEQQKNYLNGIDVVEYVKSLKVLDNSQQIIAHDLSNSSSPSSADKINTKIL